MRSTHPGQDQEPVVIDHLMELSLALSGSPSNPPIPRRDGPSRRPETEPANQLAFVPKQVTELSSGHGFVAQVMMLLHQGLIQPSGRTVLYPFQTKVFLAKDLLVRDSLGR